MFRSSVVGRSAGDSTFKLGSAIGVERTAFGVQSSRRRLVRHDDWKATMSQTGGVLQTQPRMVDSAALDSG